MNSQDTQLLEEARIIYGAKLDLHGRYFTQDKQGYRDYGYRSGVTGAYVCFTCGLLCECGEEGEE